MTRKSTNPFASEIYPDDDPLTRAMAPPLNESPEERHARVQAEEHAVKRSEAIDEELNRQRMAEKKGPKCVKLLLLGQSESGKSTTLKNFQLMNSPKAFRTERASWRAIVQLNIVRSVRLILDAMTETQTAMNNLPDAAPLTPELLKLKMRLAPLQQVEESLLRKLAVPGANEYEATHLASVTNLPHTPRKELAVYSTKQWKGAFGRLLSANERTSIDSSVEQSIDFEDPKDPGVVLHACAEDMIRLWSDPTIQQLLKAQRIRLEDMAGFFLDSLQRVTALRYVPTDDDILRARIKTLGVSEHRFKLKAGNMLSHDWRVFDVGGARSVRAAWVPYFDDLDAIIFLAPISCFDQVLAEDPSVNRLEDSILLWKSVVSHPLLQNVAIVLFLNKIDILQMKLVSGVQFSDFVVSYGDRPNTYESISSYLQKKFATIHKAHSTVPRQFYCHLTNVIDAKSTFTILSSVKDQIVHKNLQQSRLV